MKKWLFALPVAATAGAIAVNIPGFIMGGPGAWWELAVTAGYLGIWLWYLMTEPEGWQKGLSRVWWIATAICAAICIAVSARVLDASWVILPALGLITPLSGLGVLTGKAYPLFYGVCTLLAAGYGILSWKKR